MVPVRRLLFGLGLWVWAQSPLPVALTVGDSLISPQRIQCQVWEKGRWKALTHSPLPGAYLIRLVWEGKTIFTDTLRLPLQDTLRLSLPDHLLTPVEITSTLAPTSTSRSFYPIRILDEKRIQSLAAFSLPTLLGQELNMRLRQDPNLGSFLQLQGIGGQNVKFLLDGVPIIGRVDNNIDLSQLLLAGIERVEIVEGPMSVLYGTDALGGVINLISKGPTTCRWEITGRTIYESVGTYNTDFYVAGGPPKHRLTLQGGRSFFEGWDPQRRPRAKLWRPREQFFGTLQYQYGLPYGSIRIQLQGFDERLDNLADPTFTAYRIYAIDERYFTRRLSPTLHSQIRLSPTISWYQTFAFNVYRRIRQVVYKDLVTLRENLVPTPGTQDSTYEKLPWSRGFLQGKYTRLSWQMGYEAFTQEVRGPRIAQGKAHVTEINSFAALEYKLTENLALRPALRGGYNSLFTLPLTPALQLRWQIHPNWTLRSGYSRGFRSPSLREMYLYFVFTNHNIQGNPNLRPENSHHYHLHLTHTYLSSKNTLFQTRAQVFYNSLRNLIQLVVVNPATLYTTYFNLSRFHTLGTQIETEIKTSSLSLIAGTNFTSYRSEAWGWEARTSFAYQLKAWRFFYTHKYTGRQPVFITDNDGVPQLRFVGGFHWVDLSVTYSYRFLTLTAGARNLLNVQNVAANLVGGVHSGSGVSAPVGMGRFFFMQLQIRFSHAKS
ncbi:MAG: TonB-dependent receptor plug domain-containing protein [Bacteroidia bacterium]